MRKGALEIENVRHRGSRDDEWDEEEAGLLRDSGSFSKEPRKLFVVSCNDVIKYLCVLLVVVIAALLIGGKCER
jgi:hypothetical protein